MAVSRQPTRVIVKIYMDVIIVLSVNICLIAVETFKVKITYNVPTWCKQINVFFVMELSKMIISVMYPLLKKHKKQVHNYMFFFTCSIPRENPRRYPNIYVFTLSLSSEIDVLGL